MTAAVPRADLLSALSFVRPTGGNPRSFPVLGCVKIDGGRIVTTDLEVTSVAHIGSDISVCVPVGRLHDVVRLADGETVSLSVDAVHALTVIAADSTTKIFGYPVIDFPEIAQPEWTDAVVLSDVDKRALNVILKSADDTYGVFVRSTGSEFVMAATNGHRLAVATMNRTAGGDLSAIIPTAGVKSMQIMDSIDRVSHSGQHLWVEGDRGTLAIRTRDSSFPDVLTFVKTALPHRAIVDGRALNDALARVQLMSGESHRMGLTIGNGGLSLRSETAEHGSAIDGVAAEHDGTLSSYFSGAYLRDFTSVFNDRPITIEFNNGTNFIRLRPADCDIVYVVMPMR